jgi:hypothetical protein
VQPAKFTQLPDGWRGFDDDFALLTRAMLRVAQDVVTHIRFPTWPRLKRC